MGNVAPNLGHLVGGVRPSCAAERCARFCTVPMLMRVLALCVGVTLFGHADSFQEDFSTDPVERNWRIFGAASLFHWDGTQENLEVTWNSSQPNSYFAHPLDTILSKSDDFSVAFDFVMKDVAVGTTQGRPFTFEIAIGLLNWQSATNGNFQRGTGTQSPNLVEFDYFPDSGFGATISPVIVSTNSQFIPSFSLVELTPGVRFYVSMRYTAADQTLRTTMTRDGEAFGPINDVKLPASFMDFRVDTFSISGYSDIGADGSIQAHGTIDNLAVETPGPPITNLTGKFERGVWQVSFVSRASWIYTLEASDDLRVWAGVSTGTGSDGSVVTLIDARGIESGTGSAHSNAPERRPGQFYRVRAERP